MTTWSVEAGGPVRTVDAGDLDIERFRAVLRETVDLLEQADIPHAIMGGLAVASLARPRWTHDIDIFLRPDDAVRALDLLSQHGYETEKTDPVWLFKAVKDGILVDLIFRSSGDLYFDEEIAARSIETTFQGERVRVVPPEDLVVIKVCAHKEEGGYHWWDALALLSRAPIDWAYLIERSRHAVRRVLSLLVYADANDIAVPRQVIEAVWDRAYGGMDPVTGGATRPASVPSAESVRAALRGHPQVGDLDVEVAVHADRIVLTGDVATDERRDQLARAAAEIAPGMTVDNRTTITHVRETPIVEELP